LQCAQPYFGTARDDHAELGRRHVEPFGDVLADLHRPAVPAAAGDGLGLDDDLDPLQMRRECLARSRSTLPLACRLCRLELGRDRAQPGLDLVEGEGLLVGVELLGAAAEASPLQLLDDRMKGGDPCLGPLVDRRKPADLGLEFGPLRRHGHNHRSQRVDIVGKGRSTACHGSDKKHILPALKPCFLLPESLRHGPIRPTWAVACALP
jgi:hypothetical protein